MLKIDYYNLSRKDGIKNKFSLMNDSVFGQVIFLNSDSHYTINHIMEQMGGAVLPY